MFDGTEPELSVEGFSSDQIEYHLTLLKNEGLVDSPGSQPMLGITFRSLTPRGHDMVEQYREAKKAEEIHRWVSAAEAVATLSPVLNGEYNAQMRICARAHAGLIRARAARFMMDARSENNFDIPTEFWWAEGHAALTQDWDAGDFDTWLDHKYHLRAFGVRFASEDIEMLIPPNNKRSEPAATPVPSKKVFVVHGRDEAAKHEVALFLKSLELDPIILHMRPNGGRDLLTKFTEESEPPPN